MTGFPPEVRDIITHRSGGDCEICEAARAADIHHRRPRNSGGTRRPETNRASNGLALCRGCHQLVESYRNVATKLGWLVPQRFEPADCPVLYRGEWRFLTDAGVVA